MLASFVYFIAFHVHLHLVYFDTVRNNVDEMHTSVSITFYIGPLFHLTSKWCVVLR